MYHHREITAKKNAKREEKTKKTAERSGDATRAKKQKTELFNRTHP